eukprot:GILK01001255.1.p1 GENE.GILK01001255.1~~GILK01001255.1.p1  ORF type:complete len:202 (+),score=58.52 GILK01001255.1:29-634(+)
MPPKKKAAKKKAGKPGDPEESPLDPAELNKYLELQVQTLQRKLMMKTEDALRARASENELRSRVMELDRDFNEEQQRTFDITSDMTRQYKAMQEELLNRINQLENTVADQKEDLDKAQQSFEELKRTKDEIIAGKDEQILELKRKMEEMSKEFANMLKETLEKMTERIELTNNQWENEEDSPMMRRLEEFSLTGNGVAASS